MMSHNCLFDNIVEQKDEVVCVVRLTTESFKRSDTYHYSKSLRVLKRLSNFDLLSEEAGAVGIDALMESITNLCDVSDGVYRLSPDEWSTDCETGYIEFYTFKLIPYKEKENEII